MTTDWNSTLLVPTLSIQNYPPNGWNTWYTKFKLRALITPFHVLSDTEKVAVLTLKLGDEITLIYESLDLNIEKIDYEELVQRLTVYFTPIKSRNVFLSAKQKRGESFDHFANRLTMLSYTCCFGPFRESVLRDIFLSNMDVMYASIRDRILNTCEDSSFPEVLSLSKELLLGECNISCSVSPTDETTAAHSGTPSYGGDSNVPRNLMRRGEMDVGPNTKDPSNINIPPAQTTKNDTGKVAIAIKNALENGTPKLITSEVPKPDLSHNGISDTELPPRSSVGSPSNTVGESSGGQSYLRENTSNLTCSGGINGKWAGVSARLNKYRNKHSNIPESINGKTSDQNVHDGVSCVDKLDVLSSNQNLNAKTKKKKIRVEAINNTKSFGTDETKSDIATTPNKKPLSNNNADEGDSQPDTIGVKGLNSKQPVKPDSPISKTCFTEVIIVYIPENDDTFYVCPVVKYQYLGTIESELEELNKRGALGPINNITVGEKYAAPFMGSWYRSEIVAANMKKKTVRISFPDYGNEEDMTFSDLRQLPEEFQELEPLSFPIRVSKGQSEVLQSGSKIKIRPLYMDEDWTMAVELRTHQ